MKRFIRLVALLMVALTLWAVIGSAALAATADRVVTLKMGSYSLKKDDYMNPVIYRLKLKKDSRITLTWSGNKQKNAYFFVYLDKNHKTSAGSIYLNKSAKGSATYMFPKGTYYIKMYDYKEKTKLKLASASPTKTPNYTPRLATKLKARKKTTIALSPMGLCPLWYRIALTGNRAITVTKSDNCEVSLYDSKLNRISDVMISSTHVATKALCPAGTYYLRVRPNDAYEHTYIYPVTTFHWE